MNFFLLENTTVINKYLKNNFNLFYKFYIISVLFYICFYCMFSINYMSIFASLDSFYAFTINEDSYFLYFLIKDPKLCYIFLQFFTFFSFYISLLLIIKFLLDFYIIFFTDLFIIYPYITVFLRFSFIIALVSVSLAIFTNSPIDCGIIQALFQKSTLLSYGYIVQGIDCYIIHDKLRFILDSFFFDYEKRNFINSSQVFDIVKVRDYIIANPSVVERYPTLNVLLKDIDKLL